jgi:hypothetical protein
VPAQTCAPSQRRTVSPHSTAPRSAADQLTHGGTRMAIDAMAHRVLGLAGGVAGAFNRSVAGVRRLEAEAGQELVDGLAAGGGGGRRGQSSRRAWASANGLEPPGSLQLLARPETQHMLANARNGRARFGAGAPAAAWWTRPWPGRRSRRRRRRSPRARCGPTNRAPRRKAGYGTPTGTVLAPG